MAQTRRDCQNVFELSDLDTDSLCYDKLMQSIFHPLESSQKLPFWYL